MNPIEAVVRRVDRAQQRHNAPGFVFGIIKKFGDDNAGALVTNLAYAGFVSLFPLLLILITILGLVASADPAIRERGPGRGGRNRCRSSASSSPGACTSCGSPASSG